MMPSVVPAHNVRSVLIPRPLAIGDVVGVVAVSGPIRPEILRQGVAFLEEKGFQVRLGRHVSGQNGYLAGTDEERCRDLNVMLADPDVRAVLFARGGYGVMRLLDRVDHESIRKDPKILMGMSDLTALSLSLHALCGLVTWAGPMVAGQVAEGLDPLSREWFVRALTEQPLGRDFVPSSQPIRVLRPGIAEGDLIGGCLSLVTSLLGTPHVPDFADTVLLLEDVNEPPYRIDRMLTQLKLAGVLDRVAGFIVGHFLDTDGTDLSSQVEAILLDLTAENPVPIISGFPHGHALPNLALPHGIRVELVADLGPDRVSLRADSSSMLLTDTGERKEG